MIRLGFKDLIDTPIGIEANYKSIAINTEGYYTFIAKGNIHIMTVANLACQVVLLVKCNNCRFCVYIVEDSTTFIELE